MTIHLSDIMQMSQNFCAWRGLAA